MGRTKRGILHHLIMALLLVLLAAYLLVPGAIRWGLEETLRLQGFEQVSVEDVDAESIGGELRITGLSASRADGASLSLGELYVNVAWSALPRRQARLQGMAVEGLEITLAEDAEGRITISGLPLPAGGQAEEQGEPWGFGIDRLQVTGSRLHLKLRGVDKTLDLDRLELSGLRSWQTDAVARLRLRASLAGADIALDGQLTPFAVSPGAGGRLRIDGLDLASVARDLAAQLPAGSGIDAGTLGADLTVQVETGDGGLRLQQQGSLTLRELQARVHEHSHGLGAADWKGDLRFSTKDGLQAEGQLALRELSARMIDHDQRLGELRWEGKLAWSSEQGAQGDGKLTLADARLAMGERQASLDVLNWRGQASWSADAGAGTSGQLALQALEITQPDRRLMLLRLGELTVGSLTREGDSTGLTDTKARGLALLADTGKAQTAPRVRIAGIELGPSRVRGTESVQLGRLDLTGAVFELERDSQGRLPLLARLQGEPAAASDSSGTRAGQTPPAPARPQLMLDGLQLGGDSRLGFTDNTVQPAFRQDMHIDALTVGAIDSATDNWTPVTLSARLGEYSRLELAGRARPLADKVNVDLQGTLKAVDLPPLSSYAASKLGYNLQSGQLDTDLRIKIIDDQLDGEAKLVANKLNVKPADPKLMARLTRELSMPLDSALNMLRDGDDNIRLTLPVSGDIHNPDFDLSNVINKALGSALKGAAVSYLKYALQPYGSLITLAQLAGKAAAQVALQPMPFAAGSAELGGDAVPYLDKLHELLRSRPKMRIQICGLATETDRQALAQGQAARPAAEDQSKPAQGQQAIADDRLLALAGERSAAIKRQLVDRGTAPDRLFTCNPEIDRSDKATPRADLLL